MGCWLRRSFRNTQIEQHLFPPGVHPFTSVLDRKSITLEFRYTGISFFTQLQEQVTSLKLLCAEPWVWSVAVIPQPLIFPFPQSLHDHISASSGSHGWTLLGWAGPPQVPPKAAPAWRGVQPTLPTGGEPNAVVSFGEDNFVPGCAPGR